MPKAFSAEEKERIRSLLLEKASELFTRYGLRKTNIEDLTDAAGISKGAFYLFFPSKEALFLALLRQVESAQRKQISEFALDPQLSPAENLKAVLRFAFRYWEGNNMLSRFSKEDYAYLLRKLPAGAMAENLHADESFIAGMIDEWKRAGLPLARDVETTMGLMYALFFLSLHRADLRADLHERTMETMLDIVAEYLVGK
ncbi:MAG: TetR/AcrR family transcriptional regulator [Anaerolineales bacterium]|nr:TetR/AcrR family transcriptional regulator [Anaerolineales bacterium]